MLVVLGSTQDLKIGDLVLPADAKDGTKGTHMQLLQLLNVPEVQCPSLMPLERRCDNGTVDLELCGESDVLLVEHPIAKPSKCIACFDDPPCALSVKRTIVGGDAIQV